ncbi:MAG: hypothetical protein MUO62_14020 [Anaerolineales bacterium]|nr:hypothetical protein [Anaerolineales bacterium]
MNWSQLRTIIWLRWRLTRNQWSRSGQLNITLTMIVVVIGLVVGAGGGIGGVLAGNFALAKASPHSWHTFTRAISGTPQYGHFTAASYSLF